MRDSLVRVRQGTDRGSLADIADTIRLPQMGPRLIVLLLVAIAAGVTAGFVSSATSSHAGRALGSPYSFGQCPIPLEYRSAFERAAAESRLPLALLTAVADVESEFRPYARSEVGANGLLQVLPSTARAMNSDASTPDRNVLAGARYLRVLLDRFDSTELALAAYNAGPTAVQKAGGAPNRASKAYVHEVTRLWRSLNGCR
jgi:soluble lytic murein transglycosylase-like protein